MSITSGFFNSLNGDRRYNTEQMSSLFDGIINDGVFMAIGDRLKVSASGGMTVVVGSGRAWFNHTWTYNDSDFYVSVPASEIVLNRIDAIVLEVNAEETVRKNTIKVVKGTPAANPVAPALTNTPLVKQHPLAHIYVKADATSIAASDITNLVGTSQCPWVTGVVETIDTDELVEQWQARFEEIYAQLENAIEQTLAAEVVDGSVTTPKIVDEAVTAAKINADGVLDKLGGTPISKTNEKLTTLATATGAKTMSFTVKGAGSSSTNAWRRQMITVQAWSQGADFANMQLLIDLVNGAPYGESKCFVTVGRNLSVTSIIYSTSGNDTTYTITFKADAMWGLGYVTYKDGQGMSVVGADDISAGSSMVVDNYAAAPAGYGLGDYTKLLDSTTDINNIKAFGVYDWGSSKPVNAPTTYMVMVPIFKNANDGVQYFHKTTLTGAYEMAGRRVMSGGTWGEFEWDNPPMILGTEYRTTERIDGKAVYKKNVNGVVQYRLDGETTWHNYADAVGAAPAGLVQGSASFASTTEFETWLKELFNSLPTKSVSTYQVAFSTGDSPFYGGGQATLTIYKQLAAYGAIKVIRYFENQVVAEFNRQIFNNSWSGWDWVSPPMAMGAEYPTTERWNGKKVYAKTINIGNLPNANEVVISHGLYPGGIVRVTGTTSNGWAIPYERKDGRKIVVTATTTAIVVLTGTDMSDQTAAITVYYTKD